jgi:hypothetical protein
MAIFWLQSPTTENLVIWGFEDPIVTFIGAKKLAVKSAKNQSEHELYGCRAG